MIDLCSKRIGEVVECDLERRYLLVACNKDAAESSSGKICGDILAGRSSK